MSDRKQTAEQWAQTVELSEPIRWGAIEDEVLNRRPPRSPNDTAVYKFIRGIGFVLVALLAIPTFAGSALGLVLFLAGADPFFLLLCFGIAAGVPLAMLMIWWEEQAPKRDPESDPQRCFGRDLTDRVHLDAHWPGCRTRRMDRVADARRSRDRAGRLCCVLGRFQRARSDPSKTTVEFEPGQGESLLGRPETGVGSSRRARRGRPAPGYAREDAQHAGGYMVEDRRTRLRMKLPCLPTLADVAPHALRIGPHLDAQSRCALVSLLVSLHVPTQPSLWEAMTSTTSSGRSSDPVAWWFFGPRRTTKITSTTMKATPTHMACCQPAMNASCAAVTICSA